VSRKLYVGNLPFEIGETELQEVFSSAGPVDSVSIVRDQATGRPRGFAFIEMSTEEGAQAAIRTLNDTQVGGRNLAVNEARPKAARSGGGFGGGFGGGSGRRREPRW
jgi:RNA recognition motif-containing protein